MQAQRLQEFETISEGRVWKLKEEKSLLIWEEALLVLTEDSIEVSQDRGAGERPIFRVGMGEIKSVKSNKAKSMKKHAFNIVTNGKTLTFAARSDVDMNEWISLIDEHLAFDVEEVEQKISMESNITEEEVEGEVQNIEILAPERMDQQNKESFIVEEEKKNVCRVKVSSSVEEGNIGKIKVEMKKVKSDFHEEEPVLKEKDSQISRETADSGSINSKKAGVKLEYEKNVGLSMIEEHKSEVSEEVESLYKVIFQKNAELQAKSSEISILKAKVVDLELEGKAKDFTIQELTVQNQELKKTNSNRWKYVLQLQDKCKEYEKIIEEEQRIEEPMKLGKIRKNIKKDNSQLPRKKSIRELEQGEFSSIHIDNDSSSSSFDILEVSSISGGDRSLRDIFNPEGEQNITMPRLVFGYEPHQKHSKLEEEKINNKNQNENEGVIVEKEESPFGKKDSDLVIGLQRNQPWQKERQSIKHKDKQIQVDFNESMYDSKNENADAQNFSEIYWQYHRDYVENRSINLQE